MNRRPVMIIISCMLLCLSFNYTLPLHRDNAKCNFKSYLNHLDPDIAQRIKKSNEEDTVIKVRDSTHDSLKNVHGRVKTFNNAFTEDGLRQYERLVIMKKNPYLDPKEIEVKFRPSHKKMRESEHFDAGPLPQNFVGDLVWEAMEDRPAVEITNRGLSGFAIPPKTIINTKLEESRTKMNNQSPTTVDSNSGY